MSYRVGDRVAEAVGHGEEAGGDVDRGGGGGGCQQGKAGDGEDTET